MFKVAVVISPNWRDYAEKYLDDCLASVAAQDCTAELKVYLVDNESSSASRDLLKDFCQRHLSKMSWTLLTNDDNAGFAKGNNVAMRQALQDGCDAITLFNMDGILANDCLSEMIGVLVKSDDLGAVQARMMLDSDRDRINSVGNVTHFLGFGFSDGYRDLYNANQTFSKELDICYPSGAAVILRAEALRQVGLFDEEFWMYNEDQDLGWRLWLAGWRVVLAPRAVFYHKYYFAKSIKQLYWQDRNRLLAAFKNYHYLSLLILAPALLVSELGMWVAAMQGSWVKEKVRVYAYFLVPDNWWKLWRARQVTQSLRKVSDRQIIKLFSGKVAYQEIESPLVKIGNLVLNLYWQIAKRIIIW